MIRLRRQRYKIFWAVVQFISVQVVRYFASIKFATKVLFNHRSMLIHSFAVDSNASVTNHHDIACAVRSTFCGSKWIAAFAQSLIMQIAQTPTFAVSSTALDHTDLSHAGFGKWITVQTPSSPVPLAVSQSQMLSLTMFNGARSHYAYSRS
jgi:hypothetical protein